VGVEARGVGAEVGAGLLVERGHRVAIVALGLLVVHDVLRAASATRGGQQRVRLRKRVGGRLRTSWEVERQSWPSRWPLTKQNWKACSSHGTPRMLTCVSSKSHSKGDSVPESIGRVCAKRWCTYGGGGRSVEMRHRRRVGRRVASEEAEAGAPCGWCGTASPTRGVPCGT
jgi:hypothetical protein